MVAELQRSGIGWTYIMYVCICLCVWHLVYTKCSIFLFLCFFSVIHFGHKLLFIIFLLIIIQAIFRVITIKHLASMAAGALSRAVSMIDDWDGTWILNPRGTYGAGNINRYKTPVIRLKSGQLTALNVNQLHLPYAHVFHLVDAGELRSFVRSSCLVTRDWLEKKQGSCTLCIQLRVMFKSPNPKTRTAESRMVAS